MRRPLGILICELGIMGALACESTNPPGPPTSLEFVTQPASVTSTQSLGTVTVAFTAADGRVSTSARQAILIALRNGGDSAHLAGTTSVTAVDGVATFSDLSVDKAGTAYQLEVQSALVDGAISDAFAISVGAAVALRLNQDNSTAQAGELVSPLTVDVVDAGGNRVT